MPERQTATQAVQIGAETTYGTAVAASKKLRSIDFTINPTGNVLQFRSQGSKLPSVVVPGQQWTNGSISGRPVYDEIVYPLSMIFGAPTPTTVDTSARNWTFTYTPGAAMTPKSMTIEKGSSVRAGSAPGVVITDFGLHVTPNEFTIDGSIMGQLYADAITMTSSPTTIVQEPILPQTWNIWIDDTFAGLGTTKWTRAFVFDFNMGSIYSPVWTINSAPTSYAALVEDSEPTVTASLQVEADATGMALLTALRAGQTKYMRAKATSATLAGAVSALYSIEIDMAVKIAEFADFEDNDGLYVRTFPLQIVEDTNTSLEITVICKTTAL